MGGKQHSEKGGGEWTRQGNWVAEGLVSATRMMSISCTFCDKNKDNPLYPLRSQIESKDHPVTTSSYLSPSSGAFVFVALNQQLRQQQGDDKDSGNGNCNGNGNRGVVVVKGGGGLMCHCSQRRLGGGGAVLWPCPSTCVYHPMMRTCMMATTMQ
jgi:hypothetical protein